MHRHWGVLSFVFNWGSRGWGRKTLVLWSGYVILHEQQPLVLVVHLWTLDNNFILHVWNEIEQKWCTWRHFWNCKASVLFSEREQLSAPFLYPILQHSHPPTPKHTHKHTCSKLSVKAMNIFHQHPLDFCHQEHSQNPRQTHKKEQLGSSFYSGPNFQCRKKSGSWVFYLFLLI